VVRGTAEVTTGDQVRVVHENEFGLHPYRRSSPDGQHGKDSPRVNRGTDLGEDDIERLEYVYKRT